MVGLQGFEPWTSSTRKTLSTWLSVRPKLSVPNMLRAASGDVETHQSPPILRLGGSDSAGAQSGFPVDSGLPDLAPLLR